jgi:hypothetical protein
MKYRAYAMLVPTIEIFERWRARLLAEDFPEEARLLQDALDPLREAAREIAEGGEDAVDPVLVVKMLVRLNNAVARLDPDLMEEIQRDLGAMGGNRSDFLH